MCNRYQGERKLISNRKFDRLFLQHMQSCSGVATVVTHDGLSAKPKNSIQAIRVGEYCYAKFVNKNEDGTFCLRYKVNSSIDKITFMEYPSGLFNQVMF